ncbi:5-dehydro-4-deoxy-D-glucuronate isomerase [Mangrovibacter plantisponsor]|uniref:4-deoxy-L-threo-5-hexosulose-uronate ketol-isomerase n=1 Tax=Mangrovibacter plantisponsor TaxID=451513 RepID=A0A317PYH1_9ENTR|nr:5-dehydro-4-deoxy-D-glucuronate isomerase [Mangrovibacter plantisponsor]PWW06901.1 4-deoxy-L-threo-5-hexosulose-uronate ketol-isomerase [Mangrovibacter plantisponsor]
MKTTWNTHPDDVRTYDSERLRDTFLTESLFTPGEIHVVYSHIDRVVALGVCPQATPLALDEVIDTKAFGTPFFLARREMGLVNLGGPVEVTCNEGESYQLEYLDGLYLGMGTQAVSFRSLSEDPQTETAVYCLSAPAHHTWPSRIIKREEARQVELGSQQNANLRLLTQYLHPEVLTTCQLCMGITHLRPGNVWNTMPAHTHARRMEAYLYFNMAPDQVVFHFMGEPQQTRHLVVRNKQLVLSPSWSIHSGCGTRQYSFVWGMAGENQTFDDMDFVAMTDLR